MPPDGPERDDPRYMTARDSAINGAKTLNHYNSNVVGYYTIQTDIAGYTSNNSKQVVNAFTQTPTKNNSYTNTLIQQHTNTLIQQNTDTIESLKKQLGCMKSMLIVLTTQLETCEIELAKLS
tara:strand:+ start:1033 stop:1398 length:366 start_codon:yes stop_codon:yes gene_type:complete